MEPERLDNVQLQNLSDLIYLYYNRYQTALDKTASQKKNKNKFDIALLEEDVNDLTEFCNAHQIPSISQALVEVFIYVVRKNEKKLPEIRETDLFNAFLRLEKAVESTLSIEFYRNDHSGTVFKLTNFEVNMVQHISTYVTELLSENTTETLFFQVNDFYNCNTIAKLGILEKFANVKLFSQDILWMQKLKICLTERLKNEVNAWLNKETEKLQFSDSSAFLKNIDKLRKIVKDFQNQINLFIKVPAQILFKDAVSNYSEIFSNAMEEKLLPICETLMDMIDVYQLKHKNFYDNMMTICYSSAALFSQLRELANSMIIIRGLHFMGDGQHPKRETLYSLSLAFFINLLKKIKAQCYNVKMRIIQAKIKDRTQYERDILITTSTVMDYIRMEIDEWKHEEEDETGCLVKITSIICHRVKIFDESLECHVQAVNAQTKDIQSLKKWHLAYFLIYVTSPGQVRKWTYILSWLGFTELAAVGSLNDVEKLLISWLQSPATNQAFRKFLDHLDDVLESQSSFLNESSEFSEMLSLLWSSFIQLIEKHFQKGMPVEYAKTVKENVLHLKSYLLKMTMNEKDTHKALLQKLLDFLDLNSKSTENLQLDYYVQIVENTVSPVDYIGHIALQAGYKTSENDSIDLYINIQKCHMLPSWIKNTTQLTIEAELCPKILFPSYKPLKTSPVTEELDNPVFNEHLQFSNLPMDIFNVEGAALRFLVYNQDYTYRAEAILLFKQVQNVGDIVSLECLPAYHIQLRELDGNHILYKVLEQRSHSDKSAKIFIDERRKLVKNRKRFFCISAKCITCGFPRNG